MESGPAQVALLRRRRRTSCHFGRAADELHIAQPVLSRADPRAGNRISATRCFTRDSHGVMLTDAGRQLLTDAGPLLASTHAVPPPGNPWPRAAASG